MPTVGSHQPVLCGVQRAAPLAASGAVAVFALLLLALMNALWFNGFDFHTIMGDDLYAWAFYSQGPTFHGLFLDEVGGKYRPVFTAVQYVLFRQFSADYQAWVAFNIALNFLIVILVFTLIRRLTRGDTIIAFLGALLYVTARFSYYNILQLNGLLEALCILQLVIIMYLAVEFLEGQGCWPGFALVGLYLLITLTHERYVVLLPFLLLLVLFKTGITWRLRGLLLAIMFGPPLLNVLLKRLVFDTQFLMGTGGQTIGFDPVQVLKFLVKGVANMFWINWGPDYLSGLTFSSTSGSVRVLVAIIAMAVLAVAILSVVRVVRSPQQQTRVGELGGLVLFLVLVCSLLLAASITIRQEYRWLYAPFVVCVVYFCYQYGRLPGRRQLLHIALAGLCAMAVVTDTYYRGHQDNVFFIYGERFADSGYEGTIGAYGTAVRDRTIYVEESPDLQWVFGIDLFLSPYLGIDYRKITWIDDVWNVSTSPGFDPAKSVVFRIDWPSRSLVDVTEQVVSE